MFEQQAVAKTHIVKEARGVITTFTSEGKLVYQGVARLTLADQYREAYKAAFGDRPAQEVVDEVLATKEQAPKPEPVEVPEQIKSEPEPAFEPEPEPEPTPAPPVQTTPDFEPCAEFEEDHSEEPPIPEPKVKPIVSAPQSAAVIRNRYVSHGEEED